LQVSGFLFTFALGYKTMVVHPLGRTSDAQLVSAGLFLCLQSYSRDILLRLHYLVKLNCPRVSHRFVTNGKCSRFSVSAPVRFAGMVTKRCIMQQLTLQFEGFADEMQQPADASAAKQQAAHAIRSGASAVVNNCSLTGKKLFPNWEVKIPSLGITLTKANLGEACLAAVSVVGGFALMFFAAIIQG